VSCDFLLRARPGAGAACDRGYRLLNGKLFRDRTDVADSHDAVGVENNGNKLRILDRTGTATRSGWTGVMSRSERIASATLRACTGDKPEDALLWIAGSFDQHHANDRAIL